MASIFCTNCGAKHEYSGFAPNFCSKCGSSIGSNSLKSARPTPPAKKQNNDYIEDESEDSTNIDQIPEIDKLDVEIEIEGGFRTFNLEELSKNPANANAKKFKPKRYGGIEELSPTKYKRQKDEGED